MNKLFKYALALALLVSSTVVISAQSNIGYVNSVSLLQEIPEVKQADANLKDLQTQLEKKGQSMVEEFQKKYQDLQRKEQQGELSPKMLEEEGARLTEEQTKIQQYEQDMQKQLAEKQQTLLQPILDRVNEQIAEVAKEEGLDFIIDSSTQVLLYADETKDVTEKVRAKLGL